MFPLFHFNKQSLIFKFFTVIDIKFVDITFSIMKGDKFVIGALLDSMIMNREKGTSVSLSEESDSFKLRLSDFPSRHLTQRNKECAFTS